MPDGVFAVYVGICAVACGIGWVKVGEERGMVAPVVGGLRVYQPHSLG